MTLDSDTIANKYFCIQNKLLGDNLLHVLQEIFERDFDIAHDDDKAEIYVFFDNLYDDLIQVLDDRDGDFLSLQTE